MHSALLMFAECLSIHCKRNAGNSCALSGRGQNYFTTLKSGEKETLDTDIVLK